MADFFSQVFGSKPDVPSLQPTDPLAELTTMLGGEIKSWPEIEQLSSLYQSFMLSSLGDVIPGFADILKQGGLDTEAILKEADPLIHGQLPPDVANEVFSTAAGQSLRSGTLGSPMSAALGLKDLGLTSLQGMEMGANLAASGGNAAQRWEQMALSTMLPPNAYLYSPEWFSDFMAKQRASQQAIAQQRANVAAAPSPGLQALNQWVEQLGGTIIGSYLGGGGMGGKGGNYMTSFNPSSYLGGTASTPSGAGYGTGVQGTSDVSNPGYYVAPPSLNAGNIAYLPTSGYGGGLPANPFNAGYNLSLAPSDPTQAGYYGFGGG